MRAQQAWEFVAGGMLLASALSAGGTPVPVSPGAASRVARVEARCPTFSWGEVETAEEYTLAVYRVVDREVRPVMEQAVPGGALTWTPSVGRCLEEGGIYAWLVRSSGPDGLSAWSEPSLFQVGGPEPTAIERVIETVRRQVVASAERAGSAAGGSSPAGFDASSSGRQAASPGPRAAENTVEIANDSIYIGPDAVVTTASDQDTLKDLACSSGQIAVVSGSSWTCSDVPCPSGLIDCAGTCVDTSTDEAHCGSCPGTCSSGYRCLTGLCQLSCQSGLTNCSGTCVNQQTDRFNCGGCGTTCPTGQTCAGGNCTLICPAGLTNCSGTCRDTYTDENHCGGCTTVCSVGEFCQSGSCDPPP